MLVSKNFLQFNFELYNYGNTEARNLEITMKNPNKEAILHNHIHRDILLPNENIKFTFTDYNDWYSPIGVLMTWYVQISYANQFESIYSSTFDIQVRMLDNNEFQKLDDKFSIEKAKKHTLKTANFSAEIINNSIKKNQ